MLRPALVALSLLAALPARAACTGENLLARMDEATRAALVAAADAVPYPRGNFWTATKDGRTVHLVGTYHLDDPRHADTLARIAPLVDSAATVLVEAGPDEEKALMADLARNPSLMVATDGPTLRESLDDGEWTLLADAMRDRGIPPFMASKFRPWYVSVLLSLPACGMPGPDGAGKGGLDGLVIARATEKGIPLRALEPHDTVFGLFDDMPHAEQLAMIRSALALEPQGDDYAVTLADAYFDGEHRLIWELTRQLSLSVPGQDPAQVERDFARMEATLMTARNIAWIPVIEDAAADGPVFAAFGALHLPGDTGVLRLLEQAGWSIEPMAP